MIPTLFRASYVPSGSTYPEHGVVDLIDCIECYAERTEDDGSEWELAFSYPCDGQGIEEIQLDAIVVAKVNAYQQPQGFRIYAVEQKTDKILAISAQHISYDMANTPVKPYKATGASSAISKINANAVGQHHFTFSTNISSADEFKFDTPASMRAMLLNGDSSIKGTYGGDAMFDNYSFQLLSVGGANRGVVIDYGVDLIDMTQEKNNSEMITGILPYYKRLESNESYATEPIMYGSIAYGPGTYTIQRIRPVDLSEHFPNEAPTLAQLNAKAQEWVTAEEIGIPEISLTVSYAHLNKDVRIHDAIRVRFPAMSIDTTAKVVKEKYNVLLELCEEVEVGKAKSSALFDLMDASRLRKGLIPPERIANNSITEDKYANESIGSGKIAQNAVGSYEIAPLSIDHDRLAQKAVNGENIADDTITNEKIKDNAIKKRNIARDSVGSDQIVSEAVIEAKIAKNAVVNEKIKNGAVNSDKLGEGSVTTGKIGKAAVIGDKIAAKAVGEGKIDDSAVTETTIATDAVTSYKIKAKNVFYNRLSEWCQGEIDKIDVLVADMAYVDQLFASTALIDDIYAKNMHASNIYTGNITVGVLKYTTDGGSTITMTPRRVKDGDENYIWVYGANG